MKTPETNKPTGNLEELFQHHLQEASVPPRPHVWEQIDNTLLLAQNETYRRRLRGARWMAAASLLLATLAGTGWWLQRDFAPDRIATSTAPLTTQAGVDKANNRATSDLARINSASQATVASRNGQASVLSSSNPTSSASASTATPAISGRSPQSTVGLVARNPATPASRGSGRPAVQPTATIATQRGSRRAPITGIAAVAVERPWGIPHGGQRYQTLQKKGKSSPTANGLSGTGALAVTPRSARFGRGAAALARVDFPRKSAGLVVSPDARSKGTGREVASLSPTGKQENEMADATTAQPSSVLPLNGLLASVLQVPTAALPSPLATQPVLLAEIPTPSATRNWHVGFTYAISAFQSNINFSKAGVDGSQGYKTALGPTSAALSDMAAAEYKAKQRAGLGQRLRIQASRRLRGNWSLATGFELAQQESYSTTSYRFLGEQIPDFNQSARVPQPRETKARYQLVGLPLEVSYADPIRTGFSFYGRLGGVAQVLLTSHAEMEGSPEATRTYDLLSASTPYRRLLGSLRGAAGVQLRPVGHDYTLRLGPVLEGGIWSMNAYPSQDFMSQSRPYSFGMEAGVEFGRNPKKM